MVAYRANDPWLFACAAAICGVGVARTFSALIYRHSVRAPTIEQTRVWRIVYEVGAWLYAGLLGVLAWLVLRRRTPVTA